MAIKLTVEERRTAYERALKELLDPSTQWGLCSCLADKVPEEVEVAYEELHYIFPEVWLFSPNKGGGYWFPINDEYRKYREIILEFAIVMLS